MAALKETLAQQEKLLDRLQALTADQLLRSNEIEQSMPPRDLLESLQKGFIELQEKTLILEKQLSELKKGLETSGSKEKPSKSSANNFFCFLPDGSSPDNARGEIKASSNAGGKKDYLHTYQSGFFNNGKRM